LQLQRSMAAEAEAIREAKAKVCAVGARRLQARLFRMSPFTPASVSSAPVSGDRGRGRDKSVAGAEGGLAGDRPVPVSPAAALPPDPRRHRRQEELHHRHHGAV
ncbi:unnamed protein product, partial [Tetraodon nigroviridis]